MTTRWYLSSNRAYFLWVCHKELPNWIILMRPIKRDPDMERLSYVFIIHVLCAFVVIWCCLGIMWCAFYVIWCAFVILWCAFGVISDVLLSLRGVILSLLIKRLLEVSTKISLTGKHEQNLKVAIECVSWQRISSHSILYSAWWRRTFCLRHMSSALSRKVIRNTMRISLLTQNKTKWIFQTLFKGTFEIL